MHKNTIIALAAFIAFALVLFALVPPPASLTERDGASIVFGVFEGTTPCADCPGIVQRLTLMQEEPSSAEGTYELSLTYLERDVEPFVERGVWTTERGTNRDPNATVYALYREGSEDAQRFMRVDADTIRMLDMEGNEIDSSLPFNLTRVAGTVPAAVIPERRTLVGMPTCLEHLDTSGPQTLECAAGLRTDDGTYYALDASQADDATRSRLAGAGRIAVTGMVVPRAMLSSDVWTKRYAFEGMISIESVEPRP